ncbi:MAG: hypothetical protein ACLUTY_10715 [Waltera sp.]
MSKQTHRTCVRMSVEEYPPDFAESPRKGSGPGGGGQDTFLLEHILEQAHHINAHHDLSHKDGQ